MISINQSITLFVVIKSNISMNTTFFNTGRNSIGIYNFSTYLIWLSPNISFYYCWINIKSWFGHCSFSHFYFLSCHQLQYERWQYGHPVIKELADLIKLILLYICLLQFQHIPVGGAKCGTLFVLQYSFCAIFLIRIEVTLLSSTYSLYISFIYSNITLWFLFDWRVGVGR